MNTGNGGGVPFTVAIDDVAMTVTISAGTVAGVLYGSNNGTTALHVGDYATIDLVSDLTGTIEANGNILIDQMTMYLSDWSATWDAFNTTWTPAAKKTAPSNGNFASKAARFK
jgi:hypothetical protein